MRKFEAEKYKRLVEEWDDPVIQRHEEDEIKLIKNIRDSKQRTFIDLGAGYGRVLPKTAEIAGNVIAIEINPNMYNELEKRALHYENVEVVLGDIIHLETLLKEKDVREPVLLVLQNTLGTIEGNYRDVLEQMRLVVEKYQGDVVLSLYRQQALRGWGIMTYEHGQEMNGEPDLEKTDFNKGFFISKTGYTSKWWTDEEIEGFKSFFGGKLLQQIKEDQYWIFQSSYKYI